MLFNVTGWKVRGVESRGELEEQEVEGRALLTRVLFWVTLKPDQDQTAIVNG